jgi:4-hydroxybenzoate polyprenyltransferase
LILLQLPINTWIYAGFGLLLTIVYPFGKRWIQAPQLILALAFSVSIPMIFALNPQASKIIMIGLWIANLIWVFIYDTIYGLGDRSEDLKIGVQSSAIWLGPHLLPSIAVLMIWLQGLWAFLMIRLNLHFSSTVIWSLNSLLLYQQYRAIQNPTPAGCLQAFRRHFWYGFFYWLALWLEQLFRQ